MGKKAKGVSLTISVSSNRQQSMTASSQFTGTANGVLCDLSASLGLSITKAVSYTTEYSYGVPANGTPGKYRVILVWPGERAEGVVTSEPNGDGHNQIMSEDNVSRLPKKKVINTSTVQYAPKVGKAYVDIQHSK